MSEHFQVSEETMRRNGQWVDVLRMELLLLLSLLGLCGPPVAFSGR
jgi:hypothetical protein